MPLFNSPPQQVPTAIRNAVTFQDRVSMLLNGAGSSKWNPVQSQNPTGVSEGYTAGADGYSFRLSFGMASANETVEQAIAAPCNDNGEVNGAWRDFSSSIVADTAAFRFNADLHFASAFPEISAPDSVDGDPLLVAVLVSTSLGRRIHQQVWVAREPSDMVTFNGLVTTAASPLRLGVEQFNPTDQISWNVAFYAAWNDEIGRQHGAEGVALNGNIRKPYGGGATVEVFRDDSGTLTLVHAEQPIQDLHSMSSAAASGVAIKYHFRFRSRYGSSTYLVKPAWVQFYECATGGTPEEEEDCPIIGGGSTPPPSPPDGVIYDPEAHPTYDPGGNLTVWVHDMGGATSVDLLIHGYTGVHYDDAGTYRPAAGGTTGTAVYNNLRSTGAHTIQVSTLGLGANTDLLVVYPKNAGKYGAPVVFVRDDIEDGTQVRTTYPQPPSITGTPSFSFTSRILTFQLAAVNGWNATEAIAVSVTPLFGRIDRAGSEAQEATDLFLEKGSTYTQNLTTTADLAPGLKALNFSSMPTEDADAVVVKISNAAGGDSGTPYFILNAKAQTAHEVKHGPVISSAALGSGFGGANSLMQINLSDAGEQVGNFSVYVQASWLQSSQVANSSRTVSGVIYSPTTTPNMTVNLSTIGLNNKPGYYHVVVIGEQGSSNVYEVDNTGGG